METKTSNRLLYLCSYTRSKREKEDIFICQKYSITISKFWYFKLVIIYHYIILFYIYKKCKLSKIAGILILSTLFMMQYMRKKCVHTLFFMFLHLEKNF
jgi:hypothetical protein